MRSLTFWKMHGVGNDFVVLMPGRAHPYADDGLTALNWALGAGRRWMGNVGGWVMLARAMGGWAALAREMCDRRCGVGADGLLLVLPSDIANRRMRIFNSDGSEAEMSDNGIRCLVKFVFDREPGIARRARSSAAYAAGEREIMTVRSATAAAASAARGLRVETLAGVFDARASLGADGLVERVRVGMGVPRLEPEVLGALTEAAPPVLDLPIEAAGGEYLATLVSMGNPHAVLFVSDPVEAFPLERVGPAIERHPLFSRRTNVEVVRVLGPSRIEMRVWERGAGETLACGSGACAAVVAARLHGLAADRVEVALPGGTLGVEWDGEGEALLEGPAVKVFEARWDGAAARPEAAA